MEIRDSNAELKWMLANGRCHRAFDMEALVRDVCGVEMTTEGSISIVIRGFGRKPPADDTDMLGRNVRLHLVSAERPSGAHACNTRVRNFRISSFNHQIDQQCLPTPIPYQQHHPTRPT